MVSCILQKYLYKLLKKLLLGWYPKVQRLKDTNMYTLGIDIDNGYMQSQLDLYSKRPDTFHMISCNVPSLQKSTTWIFFEPDDYMLLFLAHNLTWPILKTTNTSREACISQSLSSYWNLCWEYLEGMEVGNTAENHRGLTRIQIFWTQAKFK